MKGKVKTFSKQKGYGFITVENGQEDIFFHYSSLLMEGFKTIEPGTEVDFDLETTDRGSRATNIRPIVK